MKQVLQAYEQLGTSYLDYRRFLRSDSYVRMLCNKLPKNSQVLDVGCGVGVPIDDLIIKAGHSVRGIDLSPKMVSLAKKLVKAGEYSVGDMQDLRREEYQVDGVVCMYALFHVPRREHGRLIKTFVSFLPTGGWILLSLGDRAYEGAHTMYGVMSYSSQWGSVSNRSMVEKAGLRIEIEEMAQSGGERHQIILAQKT